MQAQDWTLDGPGNWPTNATNDGRHTDHREPHAQPPQSNLDDRLDAGMNQLVGLVQRLAVTRACVGLVARGRPY
jgi:hypothetical protein